MRIADVFPAAKLHAGATDPERFFRVDGVQSDLKGRTVRGGAVTMSAELVKQCLRVVLAIVLARALTPSDNGLVSMVVSMTGFIGLFNELGFTAAIIQRPTLNQRQMSTLFWINIAGSVALAVLTCALAPAVAWFYGEPRLINITLAISSTYILAGLPLLHRAMLRRQMRFAALAVIDTVSAVLEAAIGIGMALAGYGYWSLVVLMIIGLPFEAVATWLVCPWRPGRPTRRSGVRAMLIFGGNLTGFNVANYCARNVDNLLIGRFYGSAQLGLYGKAYHLLLLPLQRINVPLAGIAVSALSRLTDAPERYCQAYVSVATKVCLLTMPLVAFMIGASDWIVLLVLGPKWIAASNMFAWLAVSGLVEPFAGSVLWLFISQGRTHQQLRWGLISSALVIAAIVAGLPWGPAGVAISYGVIGLCIRTPLLFWFVGRTGPVKTGDLYRILAPFAASTCVTLLAIGGFRWWAGPINPWLGTLAVGAITACATLLTLAALPSGRPVLHMIKDLPALLVPGRPGQRGRIIASASE